MTCIFCKIGAGEIPSEKVAENEHAVAFLDIRPLVRGHTMVIPKQHAERFADMSPSAAHGVMALAQQVARQQAKALGAQGTTIAVTDGKAAGQEVMHVHVHLVPRTQDDGFGPIHALFKGAAAAPNDVAAVGKLLRG